MRACVRVHKCNGRTHARAVSRVALAVLSRLAVRVTSSRVLQGKRSGCVGFGFGFITGPSTVDQPTQDAVRGEPPIHLRRLNGRPQPTRLAPSHAAS